MLNQELCQEKNIPKVFFGQQVLFDYYYYYLMFNNTFSHAKQYVYNVDII